MTVKEGDGSLSVTIAEPIEEFSVNGKSEKIHVTLEQEASQSITVQFKAFDGQTNAELTTVTLEPAELVFEAGETDKTIQLAASAGDFYGYITAEITTVQAVFTITNPQINFTVSSSNDETVPVVQNVRVESSGRISAKIQVLASEICDIYYMYSLRGTATPTVQEIIQQVAVENNVDEFFGQVETAKGISRATIEIKSLTPGTAYTLFAVAIDRSGNTSTIVESVEFKTIQRRNPLSFEVHCSTLNAVSIVKSGLSRFLAVSEDTLHHTGVDPTLLARRLASVQDYTYQFALQLTDADADEDPNKLISKMDANPSGVAAEIPGYDTQRLVADSINEVAGTDPAFLVDPEVTERKDDLVSISATLNSAGKICAVAQLTTEPAPDSQQIRNGLNALNISIKEGMATCTDVAYETPITLTLSNLGKFDDYYIYLTAENDLVGNPVLMDDVNIARIEDDFEGIIKEDVIWITDFASIITLALVLLAV